MVDGIEGRKSVAEFVHSCHVGETETRGDVMHGTLSHDEHMLGVVLGEHLEGGVGHHHLVLGHRDVEPVSQLVSFLLPQRVAGVGDLDMSVGSSKFRKKGGFIKIRICCQICENGNIQIS